MRLYYQREFEDSDWIHTKKVIEINEEDTLSYDAKSNILQFFLRNVHPDKNPESIVDATTACQTVNNILDNLQTLTNLPPDISSSSQTPSSYDEKFSSDDIFGSFFSGPKNFFNEEAFSEDGKSSISPDTYAMLLKNLFG